MTLSVLVGKWEAKSWYLEAWNGVLQRVVFRRKLGSVIAVSGRGDSRVKVMKCGRIQCHAMKRFTRGILDCLLQRGNWREGRPRTVALKTNSKEITCMCRVSQ